MALPVRLTRTCWSWPRSSSTGGRPAGMSVSTLMAPRSRLYVWSARTLSTSARIDVGWRSGGRWRAKSSRFWTMRRVRVASSTSRSAEWRSSSGRAGSRRMTWLNPRIEASGLLSSWATPDTSWPVASIFWAWTSSAWRRSCSVRSRTRTQEAALAVELDGGDVDLDREGSCRRRAGRPPGTRTSRRPAGHRALARTPAQVDVGQVGHALADEPRPVAAEQVHGRGVGIDDRAVVRGARTTASGLASNSAW